MTVSGIPNKVTEELSVKQNENKKFRTLLPQVIVTSASSLLLLDVGMMLAFTRLMAADNFLASKNLTVDNNTVFWVDIIMHSLKPVGSCVSGVVADSAGRKFSMMLASLPVLAGWITAAAGSPVIVIYVSSALMSLGIGLSIPPVIAYIGEISQAHLRSTFIAISGAMPYFGCLILYGLEHLLSWRIVAFMSAGIPVLSAISLFCIPESPHWLMAKGHEKKAEASLKWLRGWKQHKELFNEVNEMHICVPHPTYLQKSELSKQHNNFGAVFSYDDFIQMNGKIRYINEGHGDVTDSKEQASEAESGLPKLNRCKLDIDWIPLLIVSGYLLFWNMSTITHVLPYFTNFSEKLQILVDSYWIMIVLPVMGLISVPLFLFFLRKCGKRNLSLVCVIGAVLSNILMGFYANIYLVKHASQICTVDKSLHLVPEPHNISSFTKIADAFELLGVNRTIEPNLTSTVSYKDVLQNNLISNGDNKSPIFWVPTLVLACLILFTSFGLEELPWMYAAELFPVRSRGKWLGFAVTLAAVTSFASIKWYPYLEAKLGLNGVFWSHSLAGMISYLFLYFLLPETEGKSIYETELIFKKAEDKMAQST